MIFRIVVTFNNTDRCNEIERANRILLQRMTSILAGPASHNIIHNGVTKPLPTAKGVHGRKRGSTA